MNGKTNPLDHPGTVFDMGLLNPNPTSSKTQAGPVYRVGFEVDRETWDLFMDAETKGMMLAAKVCVCGSGEEEVMEKATTGKPYGNIASVLHYGWLYNPTVLSAAGSDEDFRTWLEQQPCAMASKGGCQGDVVAAHIRRVGKGAGTRMKPEYSALPLCHHHHQEQHGKGEDAIGGRDVVERKGRYYLGEWASHRIAEQLGYDSLGFVPPDELLVWAEDIGVDVPTEYLERAGL